MLAAFDIPLSWTELLKRTAKETSDDDCVGLAAQLTNFIDEIVRALRPIARAEILTFPEEQLRRVSNAENGAVQAAGDMASDVASSARSQARRLIAATQSAPRAGVTKRKSLPTRNRKAQKST